MNDFDTIVDGWIVFFIAATITLCEALQCLFSIFQEGIFIDQRKILMQKTNKELKAMLVGVKRISNLKKSELVELVLTA